MNGDYTLDALFAVLRISVWFVLLFGALAPLILKHVRAKRGLDRLIYAWVGLGGLLIGSVYVLTTLHLYDFISLVLVLALVPVARSWIENGKPPIRKWIIRFEQRVVRRIVHFFEREFPPPRLLIQTIYEGAKEHITLKKARPETLLAVLVALAGGLIRLYPAIINAAPFSRSWYFELQRVKQITLQNYFGSYPEPAGMHTLVNVFSKLTQVSPEMILHLQGGLSVFLLGILIYWAILELSDGRYPIAGLFGTAVYAFTPLLLMPLSMERQIEANGLDMALCFALPTILMLLRKLRMKEQVPVFYLWTGFFAAGMINLFVAYGILIPAYLLMLAAPTALDRQNRGFLFVHLLGATALTSFPFMAEVLTKGIQTDSFLRLQMFDTRVFSYFPHLPATMAEMSSWYILAAAVLALLAFSRYLYNKSAQAQVELTFLLLFILVSIAYVPYFNLGNVLVDTDQLGSFYSVLIAVLAGLIFVNLVRGLQLAAGRWNRAVDMIRVALFGLGIGVLLYGQGGIITSRTLPATMPNDFFGAYYKMIDERLPYTYAAVWPELNRNLATNRHFFMNYEYLLNEYARIDSAYHAQRDLPASQRTIEDVPPASVFIFVENPPYGDIQQGILYDAPAIMREVEQWVQQYARKPDRTVRTFFRSENATVYELVVRPGASRIDQVLSQTRPEEKEGS